MQQIVRRTEKVLALLLLVGASNLSAQTTPTPPVQQGAPTAKPAAAPAQKDKYAKIRHVNVANGGKFWVGFAGQMRERVESWSEFNFGALPAGSPLKRDDMFALTRMFLSADLHAGSRVRVFAQAKSSLSTNRELAGGRRTTDVDEIDAQQLFAEARLSASRPNANALVLQGGRFEMNFGKQRLFSNLDWANTRRAYEGGNAAYVTARSSITALWAQPVTIRFYRPDRRDSSTRVFGLYGTTRRTNFGTDVYWLGQHRDAAAWNGTAGQEKRQTVGARLWGPTRAQSAIDLEGEVAYQFGTLGTANISAQMFAGQAGYTWHKVRRTPRVFLGVDYASGDDAVGGDVGTFSQLNPQAHPHLGLADLAGRQNVVDMSGGVSASLWRKLSGVAEYHVINRASATDAFYNKAGGVARAATFGTSKAIGSDLDLTLRAPLDRYTMLMMGWSHFFPGQFIKQGGAAANAAKPIDLAYVMFQYTL